MSKSWQLSITIIIYFIISCHSRIQDIFMKQHHSSTHYCKRELLIWKDNNIHGKYCTQTIPVSFNSSLKKKKHHERQLIQKINEYCKLTTNYTMKLKIALAQNIYFLIYCVLVVQKQIVSKYKLNYNKYKHVSNNNVFPRNVSKLSWEGNFFSVMSWSNNSLFCYVCWMAPTWVPTNIVRILNFIMWIEVKVEYMNFLKGGGWLYR